MHINLAQGLPRCLWPWSCWPWRWPEVGLGGGRRADAAAASAAAELGDCDPPTKTRTYSDTHNTIRSNIVQSQQ